MNRSVESENKPQEKFGFRQEEDPVLGEIAVLEYKDTDHKKDLSVRIAPEFGSNIISFTVGLDELLWCDKTSLVDQKDLGAFTGNFVVSPIAVNREEGRQGVFEGQTLDFSEIPKPAGDEPLVHGFARLLSWDAGNVEVGEDFIRFDTSVRYGQNEGGLYVPYSEKAYPYNVTQTHRHILTKDGLTVEALFENHETEKNAPVAHMLHADFQTDRSDLENTYVTVPANAHVETKDLLPIDPPTFAPVEGTDYDLNTERPVSDLMLDDCYTKLDPKNPAIFNPKSKPYKVKITGSEEYHYFVIFTQVKDEFIALERQTSMPNALSVREKGHENEANILEVSPGETKKLWTKYSVVHETPLSV